MNDQKELEIPIEMPIVSRHIELLDVEELSLCEMPVRTQNRTDKFVRPSVESKVRIEIDPPERQSEPKYFLEKWPPEHCQLLNKFTKRSKPEINLSTQYATQVKETTLQKLVTQQNNQVKRHTDQVPIKAFNPQN